MISHSGIYHQRTAVALARRVDVPSSLPQSDGTGTVPLELNKFNAVSYIQKHATCSYNNIMNYPHLYSVKIVNQFACTHALQHFESDITRVLD